MFPRVSDSFHVSETWNEPSTSTKFPCNIGWKEKEKENNVRWSFLAVMVLLLSLRRRFPYRVDYDGSVERQTKGLGFVNFMRRRKLELELEPIVFWRSCKQKRGLILELKIARRDGQHKHEFRLTTRDMCSPRTRPYTLSFCNSWKEGGLQHGLTPV